jgi:MmyB-like transcription regulator ligand binding domain
MWAEHEVVGKRPIVKRIDHPLAGPLEFECQLMHVEDTGKRLIAYVAAPGSATAAAFRRLASLSPEESQKYIVASLET